MFLMHCVIFQRAVADDIGLLCVKLTCSIPTILCCRQADAIQLLYKHKLITQWND
jgi:hypothetical protein